MIPRIATPHCLVLLAALAAGCSSPSLNLKVWPFGGGSSTAERPRDPTGGVDYQCAAGKGFSVRRLDEGAAVWLVLPERQVRLDRSDAGGTRYDKGSLALELSGDTARLLDGSSVSHADCKPAVPAPK